MTSRIVRTLASAVLVLVLSPPAWAASESVTFLGFTSLEEGVIVARNNGEQWIVQIDFDCLAFRMHRPSYDATIRYEKEFESATWIVFTVDRDSRFCQIQGMSRMPR
jgi:hypothetical protein